MRSRPRRRRIVAHELGIGNVAAIDVGAACAGSLAALAHATAWIEAGRARNVLVIGAEITDALRRLRRPAHGAAVRRRRRRARRLRRTPRARSGRSCSAATAAPRRRSAPRAPRGVLEMEGHETFLMAVEKLSQSTREVLDARRAGARGRRPVRLPPGQLAHPHGRRRAAGAAARARVRLHRRLRQHERRKRADRARRGRARRRADARARGSCSARSAPGWCGARRCSVDAGG